MRNWIRRRPLVTCLSISFVLLIVPSAMVGVLFTTGAPWVAEGLGLAVAGGLYVALFLFWMRLVARPIHDITQSVHTLSSRCTRSWKWDWARTSRPGCTALARSAHWRRPSKR